MNVIVLGTVQFSLEMLKVIDKQANVVGVITSKTSSINSDFADLQPYCIENSIPVLTTNDVNANETLQWVGERAAKVIFCLGWSRLIKQPLLESVPMGVIGYHPAALPKNRGRHPLIWALVLGLKETASTFFFMDEGADSGDILSQQLIEISDGDDAATLYGKMIDTAKRQLPDIIEQLENDGYSRTPQDESKANYWRKRGMPDGRIDWRMSAQSIHNLVRGLTHPYVGAHFMLDSVPCTVWKSKVINCQEVENIEPGKVVSSEPENIVIKCGKNCISLTETVPQLSVKVGDYL